MAPSFLSLPNCSSLQLFTLPDRFYERFDTLLDLLGTFENDYKWLKTPRTARNDEPSTFMVYVIRPKGYQNHVHDQKIKNYHEFSLDGA
jgi:hypothetical protein